VDWTPTAPAAPLRARSLGRGVARRKRQFATPTGSGTHRTVGWRIPRFLRLLLRQVLSRQGATIPRRIRAMVFHRSAVNPNLNIGPASLPHLGFSAGHRSPGWRVWLHAG